MVEIITYIMLLCYTNSIMYKGYIHCKSFLYYFRHKYVLNYIDTNVTVKHLNVINKLKGP